MKKQLFLLFFSLLALVSQARTVTGTVIQASDGEPVTGASVAVKGVPGGAVTDIDGHYTINVPDGKDVLAFSFVGMKPLEVRIGGRSVVDVAMEENSEVLSEVVVTAMGQSQEKSRLNFSVQELREMEKLPGVQLIIDEDDFELDDDTIEEAGKDKLTRQMVEELFAIREMAEDMEDDGDVDFEGNPADRKYYVHFNSAPTEILGEDGKVVGIRVERTETGADGVMHRTGEFTDYPVQAVYHAIGYQPESVPGIAYDERGAHLANANGDGRITVDHETPDVRERLYATGWAKRGPVGLIGSTKSDALLIVTNMLEDLSAAKEHAQLAADRDPESIDRLLAERGIKPIDFAGWKRIDAYERAEGAKEGREHKKVIDPEQFRKLAHDIAD